MSTVEFGSRQEVRTSHAVVYIRVDIAHYNELLATEIDTRKIAMLHKLLAEEEAKLADWHAKNPGAKRE